MFDKRQTFGLEIIRLGLIDVLLMKFCSTSIESRYLAATSRLWHSRGMIEMIMTMKSTAVLIRLCAE